MRVFLVCRSRHSQKKILLNDYKIKWVKDHVVLFESKYKIKANETFLRKENPNSYRPLSCVTLKSIKAVSPSFRSKSTIKFRFFLL